jgi:hypothetical protein
MPNNQKAHGTITFEFISKVTKSGQRCAVPVSQDTFYRLMTLSRKTGTGIVQVVEKLFLSALDRLEAESDAK